MPKTTDAPKTDAQEPQVTAAYIAEHHPDVAAELRRAGAKAENERLAAIDEAALAGHEELIAECKADLDCTPEAAALKVVKAEKQKGGQRMALLKGDEDELGEDAPPPSTTTNATGDPGASTGDAKAREEAARILKAAGPKASEEAARILKAAAG